MVKKLNEKQLRLQELYDIKNNYRIKLELFKNDSSIPNQVIISLYENILKVDDEIKRHRLTMTLKELGLDKKTQDKCFDRLCKELDC